MVITGQLFSAQETFPNFQKFLFASYQKYYYHTQDNSLYISWILQCYGVSWNSSIGGAWIKINLPHISTLYIRPRRYFVHFVLNKEFLYTIKH